MQASVCCAICVRAKLLKTLAIRAQLHNWRSGRSSPPPPRSLLSANDSLLIGWASTAFHVCFIVRFNDHRQQHTPNSVLLLFIFSLFFLKRLWETIRLKLFHPLSSCGRTSARSLNCSANYHLRVQALLRGLGTPSLPLFCPHPLTAPEPWSQQHECARLQCMYAFDHIFCAVRFLRVCVCERSPEDCPGAGDQLSTAALALSCLGGVPHWFLWNETIWETGRHLIWSLIGLFRGRRGRASH